MKILALEHPRILSTPHFNDIANTPLWSCVMAGYVYSSLKADGQNVALLNAPDEGLDFADTADEIIKQNPDLLTINTVYFWEHTDRFFEMLQDLRQAGFQGHINLFGFFPTLHHKRILEEDSVDSIAIGECETTIVELANNLNSPEIVTGLATSNLPFTPRKQVKNLNTIPFPYRTKHQLKSTASILGSRGCYNHCSFCPIPSFYNDGPLWRGRSVENITREVKELIDLGVRDFYFIDPNFVGPGKAGKQRTLDLIEQLHPLKITFGMETRATDLDDHLMEKLVQSGLTSLLLGVESGTAHGLQDFGKNETINESETAINICRRAGIEPEIGFLMFTPDSTIESLRENLYFLKRNKLLDRLDRTANLLCHKQIIMAGTTGFKQYEQRGILEPEGRLGFIGNVGFQNKGVTKVADSIISLCHYILRETGNPKSPLFFKTAGNYQDFMVLNHILVNEVEKHINQYSLVTSESSILKLKNALNT